LHSHILDSYRYLYLYLRCTFTFELTHTVRKLAEPPFIQFHQHFHTKLWRSL